ncbi:hypothetical protein E2C01_032875 [Portunus trituberculatus]|uniref:Uncharacterized protein n=1 Tax=Portunus trituberculatus TaxID=210409 RepID=A0A5B7EX20_PORTR|nr:hypothetical protein [Portunus trituberculatus]
MTWTRFSGESKNRKVNEDGDSGQHASLPTAAAAGPSHYTDVNTTSAVPSPDDQLYRFIVLFSGFVKRRTGLL